MNRFFALLLICAASLSVGAFALSGSPQAAQSEGAKPDGMTPANADAAVPSHVVYRQLFHQVAALKEYADQLEREGKTHSPARGVFKRQAALNDEQVSILNQIAADCERDVKQQDLKAQVIIDAFRARYPDGRVPDGQVPAPPSPELVSMQAERNAIILRARDRLREAFGEEEFGRFETFIERRIASNIKRLSPAQADALPQR